MSLSPTFVGTQPRAFALGGEEVVPMADEAPLALTLLQSLDEEQRKIAVQGPKRKNLVAAAGKDGFIPEAVGVSVGTFNAAQKQALMPLLRRYIGDLPAPCAAHRLAELEKERESITFAWWGPGEKGGDFSYRLQGPSLIIEFAGQDLGGDPHNHLHSMYRDPTNEYGERLK